MSMRIGLGYDVHAFAAEDSGRPLVLGGVTIAGAPGLVGHSDGDAVAHAVADALLGAAGMGDLGTLFPATDPAYAGADSMVLLGDVARRVATAYWWVVNIDIVVAAERPKLAPHVGAMAANLARALSSVLEPMGEGIAVNVKPKRGEGVGFVGRGEGIQVWAVALLNK